MFQVSRMGTLNDEFQANNEKLSANVDQLEGEVTKMAEENNKFAENNKALEEQVGNLGVSVLRPKNSHVTGY